MPMSNPQAVTPETIVFGSCESCGAPAQIIARGMFTDYRHIAPLASLTPEEAREILASLFDEDVDGRDHTAFARGFAKLRQISEAL